MALTKTKVDLIGSEAAGVITFAPLSSASTTPSPLVRRDVISKLRLVYHLRIKYGASIPNQSPKLEIFAATVDNLNVQCHKSLATITVPTPVVNTEYQESIEIEAEGILYASHKISNLGNQAIEVYLALIEVSL